MRLNDEGVRWAAAIMSVQPPTYRGRFVFRSLTEGGGTSARDPAIAGRKRQMVTPINWSSNSTLRAAPGFAFGLAGAGGFGFPVGAFASRLRVSASSRSF
jgi:hypothetical protein